MATPPPNSPLSTRQEVALVEQWFREAWPKATRFPDPMACYSVAVRVQIVQDFRPQLQRPKSQPRPDSVKYGHLFLHHAPELCKQLRAKAATYSYMDMNDGRGRLVIVEQEKHALCEAAISKLKEAQRHVETALSAWQECCRLKIPYQDPVHFIKEAAQEAWRTVGGKMSRSVNAKDPLCKFVGLALSHIGMGRSAHDISAILKNRHRLRLSQKR